VAKRNSAPLRMTRASAATKPTEHIRYLVALEPRQRRDHSIEKRLATDEPNIRIGFRLLNQVFAGAKPDFQPGLPGRPDERPPLGQAL
jgi:hypothetical protein